MRYGVACGNCYGRYQLDNPGQGCAVADGVAAGDSPANGRGGILESMEPKR